MEFSVTKSALLNELTTTQGVVERKTTIPILSNLLVEAKGSQLTITATDLELSIRTSCDFQREREDTLMSRGPATGLTEASGRLGADGQKRGRSRNRCDSGRMGETRVRARRSLRTPGLTGCGLDAEPDLRKIGREGDDSREKSPFRFCAE